MTFVIVPNYVRDAINAKLDKALEGCPDAEKDREALYDQLLAHFHAEGVIPDFTVDKNPDYAPDKKEPADAD